MSETDGEMNSLIPIEAIHQTRGNIGSVKNQMVLKKDLSLLFGWVF